MNRSVFDLETKTEAKKEESQSENSDRATPSSGATIAFDKIEYIKHIEPRGFPPEEPNAPQDQTRAEPDDDPYFINGRKKYSNKIVFAAAVFLFFLRMI